MPKGKIGLDLDLEDDDSKLTINKDYAKNYESWRKKEELQKFKDKYGTSNVDELEGEDSDSASSVESVKWTAEDEHDFLRTLGALKSKDPKIYQNDVKFFHERQEDTANDKPKSSKKSKKEKSMTLRDYEQKLVTERGGQLSDDEEQNDKQNGLSYTEREAKLKEDLKNALHDFSADESDEDGLLKKRVKTVEEQKAEDDEYFEWLKGQKDLQNVDDDLKNLKKSWDGPNIDEGERFLRDYILNKQYETDANPEAIGEEFCPTYDEIVNEDEEETKRDEFEVKYNFRYEEPDQEFIKQFPRTVAESLRRPDTRRKEARERRKQRKEEEKKEREEEIRQIKAIQKAEMEKKLNKLKRMAGEDEDLPFDLEDLQKDFDPEEHDRKMKQFDDDEAQDEEFKEEEPPTTSSESKKKSELEFRYRKVEPGTYGLSTEEILNLDDRQLNAWVSMKKVTAYRSRNEEHNEQEAYNRKAQNVEKKKKVFASIPPKLPKPSKTNDDSKAVTSSNAESSNTNNKSNKRRHRKRKSNMDLDTQRLKSYGVSTQKLKSTLFKKKKMSN